MPTTILCPLSKNPIQEPVVYKGYIYDQSSLKALVALGKAPADLSAAAFKFPKDQFTESLLKFFKEHPDLDLIPVTEDEAAKTEAKRILDLIFNDPIHFSFPSEGILCAIDGYTYAKKSMEEHFKRQARENKPFTSPSSTLAVNVTEDFLVHPIYQHLVSSLAKAKEDGKTHTSLSGIFNNFNQADPQRIIFLVELTAELSAEVPLSRRIELHKDTSQAWLFTSIAMGVALFFTLFVISGAFGVLLLSPASAIVGLGVIIGLSIAKDAPFSYADLRPKFIKWHSNMKNPWATLVVMAALALVPTTAILWTFIGAAPTFLPLITIISLITAVQLFLNSSFFDKEASFNLNKTNQQIKVSGVLSLTFSLVLTAALSAGIFITLSSFALPLTTVILLALPVTPLIFNSLYKNIYTLRCSDFLTKLFSGQINTSLFKELFAHDIIYKIVFSSILSLVCVSLFPLLGPLGTCAAGMAAFSIGINLTGFQRKFFQLQEKKESALEAAIASALAAAPQSIAAPSTTPLTKIELEESDHANLLNKITELRTAQSLSASSRTAAEALTASAGSSGPTKKQKARAAAFASIAATQRNVLSRSSATLFTAADAADTDTTRTPLLVATASGSAAAGAEAGGGTGLFGSEVEGASCGKGYGTFGS